MIGLQTKLHCVHNMKESSAVSSEISSTAYTRDIELRGCLGFSVVTYKNTMYEWACKNVRFRSQPFRSDYRLVVGCLHNQDYGMV